MEKLAKLNATLAADESLARMLVCVNSDFKGGKVTKTQLLSWILIHYEKTLPSRIETIRKAHFDAVAHLESVLKDAKRAQKNGQTTYEMRELIEGISSQIKKTKPQKNYPSNTGSSASS